MSKHYACHYSVVRFAPYPETDEFVNVGVVLACPAIGYLDFKRADLRRRARVRRFFPELDSNIYSASMHAWVDSLSPYQNVPTDGQILNDCDRQRQRDQFKVIVRPRESILFYSDPRVILSKNPATTLDEVFGSSVERRFANVPEYKEQTMVKRLERVFREAELLERYRLNESVGNEDYRVRFPFVRLNEGQVSPRQAIKALHLDRENPTDIIRHSDDWRNVAARLKAYGTAPESLLFVLQGPASNSAPSQMRAFDQVRRDLDQDGVSYLSADAKSDILAFASDDS